MATGFLSLSCISYWVSNKTHCKAFAPSSVSVSEPEHLRACSCSCILLACGCQTWQTLGELLHKAALSSTDSLSAPLRHVSAKLNQMRESRTVFCHVQCTKAALRRHCASVQIIGQLHCPSQQLWTRKIT